VRIKKYFRIRFGREIYGRYLLEW